MLRHTLGRIPGDVIVAQAIAFEKDDGGRAAAGYTGTTGDCAARALSIATGMGYQAAYDLINKHAEGERTGKRKRGKSNARTGVYKDCMRKVMATLPGWRWVPTMQIGQGCKVHLRASELPMGRLIVAVSKHYCAVIDRVVRDTYLEDRGGTRCVYGYWIKEESSNAA